MPSEQYDKFQMKPKTIRKEYILAQQQIKKKKIIFNS